MLDFVDESQSVSRWLQQFSEVDRETAKLALRYMKMATTDEVRDDLGSALVDVIDSTPATTARVIVEPVFSKEDLERVMAAKLPIPLPSPISGSRTRSNLETLGVRVAPEATFSLLTGVVRKVAAKRAEWPTRAPYSEYLPAHIRDVESGSEKLLDLIVRDARSSHGKKSRRKSGALPWLMEPDEIVKLQESPEPVHLILLTDNVGSGGQIVDLLSGILLAARVGVFSRCALSVTVLAWTATAVGLRRVREWLASTGFNEVTEKEGAIAGSKLQISIRSLRVTQSFHDLPEGETKTRLFDLFRRFGDPDGKKAKTTQGLGFGQVASRTVLPSSSCPNTVPDFLIVPLKSIPYHPLFPGKKVGQRVFLELLSEQDEGREWQTDEAFLRDIRDRRLVQAATGFHPQSDLRWRIMLLAVAEWDRWKAISFLGAPHHKFLSSESELVKMGWLERGMLATPIGIRVVRTFGRKSNYSDFASAKRFLKRSVAAGSTVYYPQAIRGVR